MEGEPAANQEELEFQNRQEAGRNYIRRIYDQFAKPPEEVVLEEVEKTMPLSDLATALRLCGYAPTATELKELIKYGEQNCVEGTGTLPDGEAEDNVPDDPSADLQTQQAARAARAAAREARRFARVRISYQVFADASLMCFYNFRTGDALREAFRTFDPENRGGLTATDLRFILTNFGDVMTDEEINNFLTECAPDFDPEGNVAYDDLVQRLIPDFLKQM